MAGKRGRQPHMTNNSIPKLLDALRPNLPTIANDWLNAPTGSVQAWRQGAFRPSPEATAKLIARTRKHAKELLELHAPSESSARRDSLGGLFSFHSPRSPSLRLRHRAASSSCWRARPMSHDVWLCARIPNPCRPLSLQRAPGGGIAPRSYLARPSVSVSGCEPPTRGPRSVTPSSVVSRTISRPCVALLRIKRPPRRR
jgi:hypothetical protein